MVNTDYAASLDGFDFDIRLSDLAPPHYYSTDSGREYATVIYILEGRIEIQSGKKSVSARQGEIFCIPPFERCRAVWESENRIRFYSIHLTERTKNRVCGDFALAKLPEFSDETTLSRVEEIFYLTQGSETEKLRAIGLFLILWSDLRPLLEVVPRQKLSRPLTDALAIIESDIAADLRIEELARRVHISESRLYSLFRAELGQSPIRYRNGLRVSKAANLLDTTDLRIAEIAERVGFTTPAHFREVFREITGVTASEYREKSKDE